MPYQQAVFANGEFYHVFNRGVEKRTIFLDERDYQRFLCTLEYYRFKKPPIKFSLKNRPSIFKQVRDDALLVEIISFCLMPNHIHLLVRQIDEEGITKFMSKVLNSYTKYFNTKHHRVGPLFQGAFKAKRIEKEQQLLHVSRYIHLNPLVDYLVKDLRFYRYSSYLEYIYQNKGFSQSGYILSHFANPGKYEQFVLDQEDYGRTIKFMERVLMELEESN